MILSFRDDWLREFFVNDVRSKKIPSDLEDRLFRKIQMIDDATTDRWGEAKDLYPERDDFSSNRHPALSFCLSMIFSENRYPLFRIML